MRIGILGSGLMGGKLGTIFARAGHEVVFSYARSRKKLEQLAREAGGNAEPGTPEEAAEDADALLLAVHWSRVDEVLNQAGDLEEKVLVTCSLPMNAADTELVIGHTSSGAEELARKAPGTRPNLLYCGDDDDAKSSRSPCSSPCAYERDGGPELAYRFERFES